MQIVLAPTRYDKAKGRAKGTQTAGSGGCLNVEAMKARVELQRCAVCQAEEPAMDTFKKCRGCKAVVYCGKACQKKDWKTHKKVCNKK